MAIRGELRVRCRRSESLSDRPGSGRPQGHRTACACRLLAGSWWPPATQYPYAPRPICTSANGCSCPASQSLRFCPQCPRSCWTPSSCSWSGPTSWPNRTRSHSSA
uniref:(northern house mosquito) hypothetical protein n=1 Tax=Culex pipiens TaxID=7175 RepID=A0A8D8DAR5_CULPI